MKKRFGQHFLNDRSILRKIVALARIADGDTVVEIGPGAGSLTRELAAVARKVIAIEIDRDLIPALRAEMPANVEIIEGDALEVDFPEAPFHLVGNFPYQVATPLLKRAIDHREHVLDVTVMIQKEVAERIRAKPGSRDYGPLSILMQYYAEPSWGFTVSPGAFTPPPKVDSAVIRLDWRPGIPALRGFTDFVQQAFASRRKMLVNNLTRIFPTRSRAQLVSTLAEAGVSSNVRPEELSLDEFLRVYNRLNYE